MAELPDLTIGGQLKVGAGVVPSIGEGNNKINGSMFSEGPAVFGNPIHFPTAYATVMIGPLTNSDPDVVPPFAPGSLCQPVSNPYALCVSDNAAVMGNLDVNFRLQAGGDIIAGGDVRSLCNTHILSAKKDFDIQHPTKEGWRLRHVCVEGPTADVYYRGRVTNRKEIYLPSYWEGLVDLTTITVNLTPIGAHQNVIVKRIADNKIYLQSQGAIPFDCYFPVYAERVYCDRNIADDDGLTIEDYPGDNGQYNHNNG